MLSIKCAENNTKVKGTKALCEALKVNTTLAVLDLSGKQKIVITKKSVRAFIVLAVPQLAASFLGNDGAKALSELLMTNSSLTELTLEG